VFSDPAQLAGLAYPGITPSLQELPQDTLAYGYGPRQQWCDTCNDPDPIVVAGPLSLGVHDEQYPDSLDMQKALKFFADWLVDRGGLNVGGTRRPIRFEWVGDASSPFQVTNATANAVRRNDADFVFGPFSSTLTAFAALQSGGTVDPTLVAVLGSLGLPTTGLGKLMISSGATSDQVFAQNDLTFGVLPAASTVILTAFDALVHYANEVDTTGTPGQKYVEGAQPEECFYGAGSGGCKAALKVGFIHADDLLGQALCLPAQPQAQAAGLQVVSTQQVVPRFTSEADALTALTALRDAGANALVLCGYIDEVETLVDVMHSIDYAPVAVVASYVSIYDFEVKIDAGKWQLEYVMLPVLWHHSQPGVGEFSQMTSSEFDAQMTARGNIANDVSAAAFAAACCLGAAIEAANSTDTAAVASAMRGLELSEFFANITFDANGQLQAGRNVLPVVQWIPDPPNEAQQGIFPDPSSADTGTHNPIVFPMPPWKLRQCIQNQHNLTAGECRGNGRCSVTGVCACNKGYTGDTCENDFTKQWFISDGLFAIACFSAVLGICFGVLCVVWVVVFRDEARVKSLQPPFLFLIILGSVLIMSAIFPLLLDDFEHNEHTWSLSASCSARLWLHCTGFVLSYGALICKLWRVYTILNNQGGAKIVITTRTLMGRLAFLLGAQATVLACWTATCPLNWHINFDEDVTGLRTATFGSCSFRARCAMPFEALLAVIHLGLLGFGVVLSYKSRYVPTKFTEGKYIAVAIGLAIWVLVCFGGVIIFVNNVPQVIFAIQWLGLFTFGAGQLGLIFGPQVIAPLHLPRTMHRCGTAAVAIASRLLLPTGGQAAARADWLQKLDEGLVALVPLAAREEGCLAEKLIGPQRGRPRGQGATQRRAHRSVLELQDGVVPAELVPAELDDAQLAAAVDERRVGSQRRLREQERPEDGGQARVQRGVAPLAVRARPLVGPLRRGLARVRVLDRRPVLDGRPLVDRRRAAARLVEDQRDALRGVVQQVLLAAGLQAERRVDGRLVQRLLQRPAGPRRLLPLAHRAARAAFVERQAQRRRTQTGARHAPRRTIARSPRHALRLIRSESTRVPVPARSPPRWAADAGSCGG
jgi:ABC-type branched-subunit amino acid transport system substrate-binding protein